MVYADILDQHIAERCSPLLKERATPEAVIEDFNESIGIRAPVRARAARLRDFGTIGGESVAVRGG
jgi:hypothetical protein